MRLGLARGAMARGVTLERPEFQVLTVDFHSALERSLSTLLKGLKE